MKGMGNIQNMLKQAKKMQEKMQQELAEMKIEGSSGGGMVTVILDGNRNLMDIKINPVESGIIKRNCLEADYYTKEIASQIIEMKDFYKR